MILLQYSIACYLDSFATMLAGVHCAQEELLREVAWAIRPRR